jgi:predicted dehydrogenase
LIGVALIGYGYAGRTFHAPLIRATRGLELVAIASRQVERLRDEIPHAAVVPSAAEACALASVDLVVVATPNETHVPIAAAALGAGKHVVVDKPLAPTLEEARAVARLARDAGRMLTVFHNRRWDGDFLALRELLSHSTLGEVAHVESHFDRYRPAVRRRWREQPGIGSGLWQDLGPHLVDQSLQLFGLPDRVVASIAAQRRDALTDDWAHVVLEYGRRRVVLHASMLVAARLPRFIVHGEIGSWIKYGVDAQERQLVAARERSVEAGERERAYLVDGASGAERETPIPPGRYPDFYGRLRDALAGRGPNPVPPAQAVAVTAAVEAALRSSVEGRAVPMPLTDDEVREFAASMEARL